MTRKVGCTMRSRVLLFNAPVRRYFHEVLFSFSVVFFIVSLVFLFEPKFSVPFVRLEISINHLVHIRQTDLIRGYLEYSIPAMMLAFCIGIPLHVLSRTLLTNYILRSVSGILLIFSPPVFWICYYQLLGWPFGWPYRWAPLELAVAGLCLACYLLGWWNIPWWFGLLLLAGHYNFWYWVPSSNPWKADYAGPIAPILGFCSTLAWGIYNAGSRLDQEGQSALARS